MSRHNVYTTRWLKIADIWVQRISRDKSLPSLALTYLFRKATREVKHFNKEKVIEKIALEEDEILFSKTRLLDSMNFAEMGELGLRDLPVMGIKAHLPVIDRYSPP